MAKRVMDPAWLESPEFKKMTPAEELVWYRIQLAADDLGRFPLDLGRAKTALWPQGDPIPDHDVTEALHRLELRGLLVQYSWAPNDGAYQVMVWKHPAGSKKSKFPHPPAEVAQTIRAAAAPKPTTLAIEVAAGNDEIVVWMPLTGGRMEALRESTVAHWREAFPAVDVPAQLRRMRAWCLDNPERCKTGGRGVRRFIFTWLAKEQDKHRPIAAPRIGSGMLGAKQALYGRV